MKPNDEDLRKLRGQIEKTSSGRGLNSVQSQKNIAKAIQLLRGKGKTRPLIMNVLRQSLEISPEAFILLSSAYAPDTLNRKSKENCANLIELIRQQKEALTNHAILSSLAIVYGVTPREG